MPPLRERREDIPLLVQGLLARIAARLERPTPTITPAALARLTEDDWPGNVRELENRLSQALLQTHHALITPEMLELGGGRGGQQGPLGGDAETAFGRHASGSAGDQASVLRSLDEVASAHIQQVLDHTQGHKGQACEVLGISRPALDRKIEKYQLRVMKR
ncbi:hypothetical protein CKO42_24320 [Lamprobacter modestohalophilus]|uniref:Sigma-54 factor interaction domain-containing protein n=1 Tax=Lamprobacter modestohalophilus TaxID=1064514 RepID=A0A9X1B6U5_9GAMM|nr:helix-turn-helix domain-containing protein [Lamprobacter modestohalophilus]MBK1621479.1 hypothetical protein [Lamprobacter modestohalophilus]